MLIYQKGARMEIEDYKIWFCVSGPFAQFTDPLFYNSSQKYTYPIPTYEAIRNIAKNIYWKPTIEWVIDKIRVVNQIKTETISQAPMKFLSSGRVPSTGTYLRDCRYYVE